MACSVPANQSEDPKSTYGKAVLSLQNCILPPDKLFPTPSVSDGLDRESEINLRVLGCELIQTSGVLLRLPQVAMATGQILFQRFYYSQSFVRHSMEFVAMACMNLASKIEESCRRIRDVINVFHHIKQMKSGKTIQPLILNQNYIYHKNQVIKAERRVLKELGFCVHVKHPHKFIITVLEVLEVKNHYLLQTSWNYMNDSLRSEVFLLYHPETIACTCIYLSAKLLQVPLPRNPAWYLVFGVCDEDIHSVCRMILSLYTRKKPDGEKLNKMVEQLRKAREAKRNKKALSSVSSESVKNHYFSPMTLSPNDIKLPVVEARKENGDVPKPDGENTRRENSYSCGGDVSYIQKHGRSTSVDSVSIKSSHSLRHKHKSLSRSYKKTWRSRSRSKSHKAKKCERYSSHKKKVHHNCGPEPNQENNHKDKNSATGDVSSYSKKHCRSTSAGTISSHRGGRSTSVDSAAIESSHNPRYRHKSLSRSYKKARRSRSRSKSHKAKKSEHHSSHKKKVHYNDVPEPNRGNHHKEKTYSAAGYVSSYSKKRGRSASVGTVSSHHSCSPRLSLSGSLEKTPGSCSQSRTHEDKKSEHHSSHKKRRNSHCPLDKQSSKQEKLL